MEAQKLFHFPGTCRKDEFIPYRAGGSKNATEKDISDPLVGLMFRRRCGENGNGNIEGILSSYNPVTEKIIDTEGRFLDENTPKEPVEVKRVLLLGSNYPLWAQVPPEIIFKDGRTEVCQNAKFDESIQGPHDSELLTFASVLYAKKYIFDKHGIPSTIMYMPSDLAPGPVKDISAIRAKYKEQKIIDPKMGEAIANYGYSGLPVVSNQEMDSDKSLKEKISGGSAVWWALESEFRSFAGHLLEKLVNRGIESVVEQYNASLSLDEWRQLNREKKDTWALSLEDGTYYIRFTREKKQTLHIPIGSQTKGKDGQPTAGAPKCALITSSLMMKSWQEYGFSHLLAAFHSNEVPIASAGFFLSRLFFGVPIQTYVAQVDKERLEGGPCTANGKAAFSGKFYAEAEPEENGWQADPTTPKDKL